MITGKPYFHGSPVNIAELVVARLEELGIVQAFTVTGGAAMHLNVALGKSMQIKTVYMHHEQACSMAAEGYARIAKKPAIVNVTSGPGAINSLNGIFGAYTDSIPLVVVAGQTRSDTLKASSGMVGLRQLGDQELDSLAMVQKITKLAIEITKDDDFIRVVRKIDWAFQESVSGRPGPVWIEIPVDVQSKVLIEEPMPPQLETLQNREESDLQVEHLLKAMRECDRPVFMFGTGVRISEVHEELIALAEKYSIPIVTAWTHDTIQSDHLNFVGRAGTIGTRPGNIVVQQSDLLIVFGSRLNIRQISYNWKSFARNAKIIQIDIDENELKKPFPKVSHSILADLKVFTPVLVKKMENLGFDFAPWLSWCRDIKEKFDLKPEEYSLSNTGTLNPYHIIPSIIDSVPENTVIVCGNATACIVPFQTARLRKGMRIFSNSGSASMGYDLPAAIGASLAGAHNVLCFAGDGSIMMNLQELQTLKNLQLNIKLVILNNQGYLSIKQTQENFFGSRFGADEKSGVTFPNFENISKAFNLNVLTLNHYDWKFKLTELFSKLGPEVIIVNLDPNQEFAPRLKSKMVNGKIETPELDDMFPFLPEKVVDEFRTSPLSLRRRNFVK